MADPITRATFPYENYLTTVQGLPDAPKDLTDEQKQLVYDGAVQDYLAEVKKANKLSTLDAQKAAVDRFGDDGRQALGLPQQAVNPKQYVTPEVFKQYVDFRNKDNALDAGSVNDLVSDYAKELSDKKNYFRFPEFQGATARKALKRQLLTELEDKGVAKDTLLSDFTLPEPAPVAHPEGQQQPEDKGFLSRPLPGGIYSPDAGPQTPEAAQRQQSVEAINKGLIDLVSNPIGFLGKAAGEETILGKLGAKTDEIRAGLISGATDTAGKAAEGVDTLGTILERKLGAKESGATRLFSTDPKTGEFQFIRHIPADVYNEALAKNESLGALQTLGRDVQEYAKAVSRDVDKESLTYKTGQVTGQLATFIAAGLAGGAPGALAASITSGAEYQLDDYEQALLKKGEKFSPEEADTIALYGAAIGSLESLPVFGTLGRLAGTKTVPGIIGYLNKESGGALLKAIKRGTVGAIEEGTQEVISQLAQNWVAKDLVAYDKERNLWTGTAEAGQTGAAAGGVLNALLGMVSGGRRGRAVIEENGGKVPQDIPPAEVAPTGEPKPAEPAQAPTQAAEPAQAPTQAAEPAQAPTQATESAQAPTQATESAQAPTQATESAQAPTQATEPAKPDTVQAQQPGPAPKPEPTQVDKPPVKPSPATRKKKVSAEILKRIDEDIPRVVESLTKDTPKAGYARINSIMRDGTPEQKQLLVESLNIPEVRNHLTQVSKEQPSPIDIEAGVKTNAEVAKEVLAIIEGGQKGVDAGVSPLNDVGDAVVVELGDGSYAASKGRRTAIADTATQALDDVDMNVATIGTALPQNSEHTITTDGNDTSAVVYTDRGDVVVEFKGPQAEASLRRLYEANDSKSPFRLLHGVEITHNTDDTYTLQLGDTVTQASNVDVAAMKALRDKYFEDLKKTKLNVFQIEPETEPTSLGITQPSGIQPSKKYPSGFRPPRFNDIKAQVKTLEGRGFNVLEAKPTRITATKNGLLYQIDLGALTVDQISGKRRSRGGGVDYTANVVITDKGGNIVNGGIQNTPITDVNGQLLTQSLTIAEPQVGFRVLRPKRGGEQLEPRFDPANILEVTRRTGGDIDILEPNFIKIQYPEDTLTLYVDKGRVFTALGNGVRQEITGDHFIVDADGNAKASILIDKLIAAGYAKTNKGNSFINRDGAVITLDTLPGGGVRLVNEAGDTVSVDSLASYRENDSLPPELQSLDFARYITDNLAPTDQGTFRLAPPNDSAPGFVFDVDSLDAAEQVVFAAETQGTAYESPDGINPETALLSQQDTITEQELRELVERVFSPAVSNAIRFHTKPNPAVFGKTSVGKFFPGTDGAGTFIHIQTYNRTPHQILDTLSEEVAHFGFDIFTGNFQLGSPINRLYTALFDHLKGRIAGEPGLRPYIDSYKIDINNPADVDVWLLVNEYLSKQGVSFIDFRTKKVSPPPGVSQADFEAMREAIDKSGFREYVFDVRGRTKLKDEAENLVWRFMELQTAAVRQKDFKVTYQTDKGDYVVRPTPFGKSLDYTPHGSGRAEFNARRKRLRKREGEFVRMSTARWLMYRFMDNFNIRDTFIGNENTVLLANAVSTEESNAAAGRKRLLYQYETLKRFARDKGVVLPTTATESFSRALKDAGVINKKYVNIAADMDALMQEGTDLKFSNTARLIQIYREAKDTVYQWAREDATGQVRTALPEYLGSLDAQLRTKSAEWSHRRYDAFSKPGLRRLQLMLQEVKRPVTYQSLKSRAVAAKKELDTLLDKPNPSKKDYRRIEKLNDQVQVYRRLQALHTFTLAKIGITPNAAQKVSDQMGSYIQALIIKNKQARRLGTGKLSEVDSQNARTLDIDGSDSDALKAEFLGQITDPIETILHDLDQQAQEIAAVDSANKLAKALIADNIAIQIPLTEEFSSFSEVLGNNRALARGQKGTLLDFISVDDVFAEHIAEEVNFHTFVGSTILRRINTLMSEIKRNLTVRSMFGITSSHVGNISMLVTSGHLFNISRWAEASKEIRNAWRFRFSPDINTRRFTSQIVEEMSRAQLLGSGVNAATMEATQANLISTLIEGVNQYLGSDIAVAAAENIGRFDNFMADAFSFSDDWPKVLPYLVNRAIGLAEAELSIKRADFEATASGEARFEKAKERFAIDFAAERTRRETVNWELTPLFLKKLSNIRVFTPDFIAHFFQMGRTILENHVLIAEDYARARELNEQGNKDLAKMYMTGATKRAVGTTINDGFVVAASFFGFSALGALGQLIADQFRDEEDEREDAKKPVSAQTRYTDDQYEGAATLVRAYSVLTNQNFEAMPFRNGDLMIATSSQRASASRSFESAGPISFAAQSSKPLSDRANEAAVSAASVVLSINNGTIASEAVNMFMHGRTKFGGAASDQDKANFVKRLLVPVGAQNLWELGTGETFMSEQDRNRGYLLGTLFTGIKTKQLSAKRVLANYGSYVKRQNSAWTDGNKRGFIQAITASDRIDSTAMQALIKPMKQRANTLFLEAAEVAQAGVKYGYTPAQVVEYLSVGPEKDKRLGKKQAQAIIAGRNPFDAAVLTSIENKLKAFNKATPSDDRYNAQDLENIRANLKLARDLYRARK